MSAPAATRLPITVIVPTFNEQENIEDCLRSVQWADEILVVDSFSTDATLDIARRFTVRILQREYVNSASQKNWAIPQAAHRWVMVVDSDERVTPELRDEILGLLESGPDSDGYVIRRVNHFLGRRIRHGGWARDRVLRFWDRTKGRYQDKEVHADVDIAGRVRELRHPLLHITFRSWDSYLRKIDRYTSWGADDLIRRGRRATLLDLVFRPPARFLKRYVLQLGFLDGVPGLMITGIDTWVVFVKYARLWERGRSGDA
ncbi:MAG TPA: glycosyltransferase family 2 protein [Candidatus Polarisedimenticolia bacterium]|nr:glycosyltransferase family 2 protein [Candidatus Polarisedimenticolia bacterium]